MKLDLRDSLLPEEERLDEPLPLFDTRVEGRSGGRAYNLVKAGQLPHRSAQMRSVATQRERRQQRDRVAAVLDLAAPIAIGRVPSAVVVQREVLVSNLV